MKKSKLEAKGPYLKYRWLIIRREMGHLCAYVKLWKGHPLEALFKTEEVPYDKIDIGCHGGLTYSRRFTKKSLDKESKALGYTEDCWIGWDYAHAGDYVSYLPSLGDKKWTVDEIMKDCYEVIDELTKKYL